MDQRTPPPPPPMPPTLPPAHVGQSPEGEDASATPAVVPPLNQTSVAPRPLSRFNFNIQSKLTLVQSVGAHGAHVAEHGHLDAVFEEVRKTFIQNLPPSTWTTHSKPSVKTLRDKFRYMMRARRTVDRSNAGASGIAEDITETDQVLDDLITEKDEEEEEKKVARDEASAKESDLIEKGFELRGAASCRTQSESEEEKKARREERANNRKRRLEEGTDGDEWSQMMRTQLVERREEMKRANDIRTQEVALMRERFEQDRQERQDDRQERQAAAEQNAKQLEFMASITSVLYKLK